MHSAGLEDLWDERARLVELLEVVEWLQPQPLATSVPPSSAGIYVLTFRKSKLRCYSKAVSTGWPVYVGSAMDLRQRVSDHRVKLGRIRNIDLASVTVSTVTAPSLASAVYAERLLIDTYKSAWNAPWMAGFGSRKLGANRSGQMRSPFARFHPLVGEISPGSDRELRLRLIGHLEETCRERRLHLERSETTCPASSRLRLVKTPMPDAPAAPSW